MLLALDDDVLLCVLRESSPSSLVSAALACQRLRTLARLLLLGTRLLSLRCGSRVADLEEVPRRVPPRDPAIGVWDLEEEEADCCTDATLRILVWLAPGVRELVLSGMDRIKFSNVSFKGTRLGSIHVDRCMRVTRSLGLRLARLRVAPGLRSVAAPLLLGVDELRMSEQDADALDGKVCVYGCAAPALEQPCTRCGDPVCEEHQACDSLTLELSRCHRCPAVRCCVCDPHGCSAVMKLGDRYVFLCGECM